VICSAEWTHFVAASVPGIGDGPQQAGEAGAAVAVVGREVGAGVERLQVGRQKDRHWPAALPLVEHLHRGHVDMVEVGAFLAVNLDGDEMLVENRGDVGVLETLVFHHMAPVARRISHRQKDRPLQVAGAPQCLFTPGIPVHRIVGVLTQIQAGLVG
jgi:hypothetical protein